MGPQHFVMVDNDQSGYRQDGNQNQLDYCIEIEFHYAQSIGEKEISNQDGEQDPEIPEDFFFNIPDGRGEFFREKTWNKKQIEAQRKKSNKSEAQHEIIFLLCVQQTDIKRLKKPKEHKHANADKKDQPGSIL